MCHQWFFVGGKATRPTRKWREKCLAGNSISTKPFSSALGAGAGSWFSRPICRFDVHSWSASQPHHALTERRLVLPRSSPPALFDSRYCFHEAIDKIVVNSTRFPIKSDLRLTAAIFLNSRIEWRISYIMGTGQICHIWPTTMWGRLMINAKYINGKSSHLCCYSHKLY